MDLNLVCIRLENTMDEIKFNVEICTKLNMGKNRILCYSSSYSNTYLHTQQPPCFRRGWMWRCQEEHQPFRCSLDGGGAQKGSGIRERKVMFEVQQQDIHSALAFIEEHNSTNLYLLRQIPNNSHCPQSNHRKRQSLCPALLPLLEQPQQDPHRLQHY